MEIKEIQASFKTSHEFVSKIFLSTWSFCKFKGFSFYLPLKKMHHLKKTKNQRRKYPNKNPKLSRKDLFLNCIQCNVKHTNKFPPSVCVWSVSVLPQFLTLPARFMTLQLELLPFGTAMLCLGNFSFNPFLPGTVPTTSGTTNWPQVVSAGVTRAANNQSYHWLLN